jgi:hypothetical protein
MRTADLFETLWEQYAGENPSAEKIAGLFRSKGEKVVNDHVAFRTFDDPRVNIEVLSRPFVELGYIPKGDYYFKVKKLRARHFELPGEAEAPRIFISELMLDEFSEGLRSTIRNALDGVPDALWSSPGLIHHGGIFSKPSYEVYDRLRKESEYAAWLYAFGFRANHFTVSVNHLSMFNRLEEVNDFLKQQGFALNTSGGEIKGSPGQLLEQSSTLADRVEVRFAEGVHTIPLCYYEFALRYPAEDGKVFSGFIAGSADRIFESTDFRDK